MHRNYPRNQGWSNQARRAGDGDAGARKWSAEALGQLMHDHPELRLQDDPLTWQLIQMISADPDDRDTQELLAEHIRFHQLAFLGSGDAFWGNYPAPGSLIYPAGFLPLGIMATGDALGLVLDQLNGNVLWLGPTKSGKTTLLSILLSQVALLGNARIIVFAKKRGELADLALIPEIRHLVTILRLEDLMLSYFQPPPGVSELAWITESVRILAQCYARYAAQRLMQEKVKELMARHPDGAYPTLGQLLEALDRFKPRFGLREAAYRESASWLLADILSSANIWSHSSSTFLPLLYSGSGLCIIEADACPQEHLTFLATYFMRWLYLHRVCAGMGRGMLVVFILEDATAAVNAQRDWETPGGVSPISDCMYMGQRLGMGVICVAHTLDDTSKIIRKNVEAFVVCGLPSEDPKLICDTLMVTPEQADKIQVLHPGELVLRNGALWDRTVYGVYQKPQIPGPISESDQRETAARFLKNVEAHAAAPFDAFDPKPVPRPADPKKGPPSKGLSLEQIEMLVTIASGVPKTAGKVYEAMGGLSRSQCVKIVKSLEAVGAIAAHRFSTGRIGGQICFFEVLDYGWTILQARGISKPAPLTNGGFEHELAAQLLKAEATRSGFDIQFEVDVGGVRMDAVMSNKKTGQKICVNVGISKPDHEIDSLQKFFTLPVAQSARFVLVTRDVVFSKAVHKLLKRRRIPDAIVQQVNIRVIADLVKE